MSIMAYICVCVLGFLFILPIPYSRYTTTTCYNNNIEYNHDNTTSSYSIDIHVEFNSGTKDLVHHNATIYNECIKQSEEELQSCAKQYLEKFTCYYREQTTIVNVNGTIQLEQFVVLTKDQIWEEYSTGVKTALRTEIIVGSMLSGLFIVILGVAFLRNRSNLRSFYSRCNQFFILQPVSGYEDDSYFFDETESHSVASFISTETSFDSHRKRQCHSILSYSGKQVTGRGMNSMMREKVFWYYTPRSRNVLKSVEAGNTFVVLVALTFLSILAWFALLFFGLLMMSLHLVLFTAFLVLPIPLIITGLMIVSYAHVHKAHYFLTEIRPIVLVELPLKLGCIVYSKHFRDIGSVKVHQFYSNVTDAQSPMGDDEFASHPRRGGPLTVTDNESLLLDLGDDTDGAVAVLPRGRSSKDYIAMFHFVPNVDSITEWIRRKIQFSQYDEQQRIQQEDDEETSPQPQQSQQQQDELDEYQ
jgi:hypothetical protein